MTNSIPNLSVRDLYILLLKYYRRPLKPAKILWVFEDEEVKYLDEYVDQLKNLNIRLKIIEKLVLSGLSIDKVAEAVDWRDFEELVRHYFRNYGFKTFKNLRVWRYEYDVIAIKGDLLICIDCKHWDRPVYPSRASEIAENLVRRCKYLKKKVEYRRHRIFGVIVTLRDINTIFIEGIPIVSIYYLRSLIEELYTLIYNGVMKEII